MKALASLGLAALLSLSLPQEPVQEPVEEPPMWDLGIEARNQKLYEAIQGGWMLTEYKRPGARADEVMTRGYLLIGSGFLSLEMHGMLRNGPTDDIAFQSGTHSFDFTPLGNLQATSLIGTFSMGEDEGTAFERPGVVREFRVVYSGETLTLVRIGDQSRISFRRIQSEQKSGRDLYGREVENSEK